MNYVDAHVWTPDTALYPRANGYTKDDMRPASFTPEDLFTVCCMYGSVSPLFFGELIEFRLDLLLLAVVDQCGSCPAGDRPTRADSEHHWRGHHGSRRDRERRQKS